MDVEHLSKSQIVLLVLLCTFVASIATAIVTVSLLAQAPPAVPQTINHIIQRTVEAVTPEGEDPVTTIKETTVVVKEDELLSSTIATSFAKLAIVHEGIGTSTPAVALGTLVGGVLITDSSLVSEQHMISIGTQSMLMKVRTKYPEVGIAVMIPAAEGVTAPAGLRIADVAQVKLGQSVVALPSASGTRVGIGAVTARYNLGKVVKDKDEVTVRAVDTSVSGKITPGAPVLSAFGDVIGIATGISQGPSGGASTFVALSDLAPLIFGVKGTTTPAVADPAPLSN